MFSTDQAIAGNTYTVSVMAMLPTSQCSIKTFTVVVHDCRLSEITGTFWLTSTSDLLTLDYQIDSGVIFEQFRYVNDNSLCDSETYDIEYQDPGTSSWISDPDAIV